MRILHYILGLPPYRTGGLTKYSMDLAKEQKKNGEDVFILFPGELTISRKNEIKYYRQYEGIETYRVLNPLPVSILKGIKNSNDFMKQGNIEEYMKILKYLKLDIIHIHTLMGLHKEFIEAAKKNKIKLIYTTHDYFGICPKANLVDFKFENCFDYNNGENCFLCNQSAPSTKKLRIGTSEIYRELRMNKISFVLKNIIKKTKKNKQVKYKKNQKEKIKEKDDSLNYRKLREFYVEILSEIDCIHYNSNISKDIFQRYLKNDKYKVVFITHNDIKKDWNFKKKESSKIRLSFLGTNHKIKGLDILLETFEKIENEVKKEYILNIFGVEGNSSSNIKFYGEYQHSDLKNIFSQTDFVVIPSTWYETFNLVALESKVFDTPVIISNTVGAKDIFKESEKIEIDPNNKSLQNVLENLNLLKSKKIINLGNQSYDLKNHAKKIKEQIYEIKK